MTVRRSDNSSVPAQIQPSETEGIVTNNKDPMGGYKNETENPFSKDVFETEVNSHPGLYSDQKSQTKPEPVKKEENLNVKYTMFLE